MGNKLTKSNDSTFTRHSLCIMGKLFSARTDNYEIYYRFGLKYDNPVTFTKVFT